MCFSIVCFGLVCRYCVSHRRLVHCIFFALKYFSCYFRARPSKCIFVFLGVTCFFVIFSRTKVTRWKVQTRRYEKIKALTYVCTRSASKSLCSNVLCTNLLCVLCLYIKKGEKSTKNSVKCRTGPKTKFWRIALARSFHQISSFNLIESVCIIVIFCVAAVCVTNIFVPKIWEKIWENTNYTAWVCGQNYEDVSGWLRFKHGIKFETCVACRIWM